MLGAAGLTGCLGAPAGQAAQQRPTPVDLSGSKADDEGGMVIGLHGGPNGQIFYRNNSPDGRENPAWFHTLAFGLFPYYFEHEREGWEATAIYVTDYSTVDYTLSTEGDPTLPSPTAPDTFGDATQMHYVMESRVSGGMGPALVPFSARADADSFGDEYGGRVVVFDEITPELIATYTRK
nr:nitrous oxide reductase accessory protein NosL [Haloarcula salina]